MSTQELSMLSNDGDTVVKNLDSELSNLKVEVCQCINTGRQLLWVVSKETNNNNIVCCYSNDTLNFM